MYINTVVDANNLRLIANIAYNFSKLPSGFSTAAEYLDFLMICDGYTDNNIVRVSSVEYELNSSRESPELIVTFLYKDHNGNEATDKYHIYASDEGARTGSF